MEFIQIAYCCTMPFLVLMVLWENRYRFFFRNLIAVSVFLLIGHAVFLMRQLAALYQISKQWQLHEPAVSPVSDSTLVRLLLIIILPYLSLLPRFRSSVVLGLVLLVLLYLNYPLHTWNLFGLFNKIPVYLSLLSATYGLFWLLNLLPYQNPQPVMYSPLQLGFKYIHYYLTAYNGKGHGMHSPFVFSFITNVLNDDRQFYAYQRIENLRQLLLHDERVLTIEDMGAGSMVKKDNTRKVADIAATSLKPGKFGQLFFRIADHYAPKKILELGTSLGVTTAYLASAGKDSQVTTLEGASEVAAIASTNFNKLELSNITLVQGNFDDTLGPVLQKNGNFDMVFVDGNHRYEPTLRYFHQLLPCLHENSILIFDDIHCGGEMEQAWKEIMAHEAVTLSIDLFFIGLVFFRKEQKVKQYFPIRF